MNGKQEQQITALGDPPGPNRPGLLVATVDTLPEPYAVIGLVEAAIAVPIHVVPTTRLFDELEHQAAAMGANAVIGVRLSQLTVPGTSRARLVGRVVDHDGGSVLAIALGTAVRVDCGERHRHGRSGGLRQGR